MLKDTSVGVGSAPIGAAGDAVGPGTRFGIDETQRDAPRYEDAYREALVMENELLNEGYGSPGATFAVARMVIVFAVLFGAIIG